MHQFSTAIQQDPDLQQALAFAKQEVAEGRAIRWIIEEGELSVETGQGWSVWYPVPAPCQYEGY